MRALRLFVPVALVLACVLGSGFQLSYRKDRDWNQDEAIAFLESTCHLREFQELVHSGKPPYGMWAEARVWQRFIESEGKLCLGQIRRDLLERDIHPPLYFWVLHLWLLANGGDRAFTATFGLNLLLAAIGVLALYKLGRTVFASRLDGVVVAFIAALNPITAFATAEFRPYALLGPVTAVYLLALVRAVPAVPTRRQTYLRGAALSLATSAGLLTHHLFGMVLLGGAVYAAARLFRKPRELLRVGAFSVFGLVLALAIFPLFTQITDNEWAVEPAKTRFSTRYKRLGIAFGTLLPKFDDRTAIFACAVGLIVLLLGIAWNDWPRGGFRRTRGLTIALVVLIVPGAFALQYALGYSPSHAMTPKYLATVWPLTGLFTVLVLRLFGRHRFAIAAGCCTLLAAATLSRVDKRWDKLFGNPRVMWEHDRLVIDEATRAHTPMVFSRIKPDAKVFVASQEFLLQSQAWRSPESVTFVTCLDGKRAEERSAQLALILAATHEPKRGRGWDSCWYARYYKTLQR